MEKEIEARVYRLIDAMKNAGRYDMSAAHYMERELIKAEGEYNRILRELWAAQYRLESAARGLVNWSQESQYQRDGAGEIIGGYRAHPNYAEVWKEEPTNG
jgi:hypothetical protein